MAAITVEPAVKDSVNVQYNTKCPVSLISVLKPLISVMKHCADVVETFTISGTGV